MKKMISLIACTVFMLSGCTPEEEEPLYEDRTTDYIPEDIVSEEVKPDDLPS